MKKSFLLLAAMCCFVINLWAGNTITYTADQKLTEVTGDWNKGFHPNAFNVAITSHNFSNGKGTITFAGELTTIEKFAFYDCWNILSLTIPNSVTSIGEYAFRLVCNVEYNGTAQSSTNWDAKCLNGYIENNLVYSDATKTKLCACPSFVFGAMTIPNTVITIGEQAFAYCDGITSVTIPNSVTTIEYGAFDRMSKVTELTIPASVTSIANHVFRYWSESLTTIRVEEGNPNYDSRNDCNALIETATNTLVLGCINTVIPNTITVIGGYAFYECKNLTSVIIPASVTEIGQLAFGKCSFTEITLPGSLEKIGSQAFFGCELTKITCLATTPPACYGGSYPSFYVDKTTPVYVPKGSIAAYQSAEEWKEFTNIQAYTKNYNLFVKGEQVTFDNSGDILGDGTVSYDEISNTLTLNNATISCDGKNAITISESQPVTIECIGTNTITTTGNAFAVVNTGFGGTTFTGSGSVNMSSESPTYFGVMGSLTIQGGCSVTLQSSSGSCIGAGTLTVDDASLVAKGNGKAVTIVCSGLTMENGVQIRSNHTFDAAQKKFLNAAGEEAMDEIIIKTGRNYNGICVDNICIKNNSDELVPMEGVDFGNLHAGSTYTFPFYLSLKNNADDNLPQGSQITFACSVNGIISYKNGVLTLNKEMKKGSTLSSLRFDVSISSTSLKTGENSISVQVTKIIDDNNIEHTCTSDACIAHFYVNIQYSVKANAEDETKGSVTGGGYYDEGTDVTLTATPNEGYKFKEWSDGSTDNPYTFTVTNNTTLTAIFEELSEGIDEVTDSQKPQVENQKFIRDGILYIRRNGKTYDAQGMQVK